MNPFMRHGILPVLPMFLAYSVVGDCRLQSPASLKLDVPCGVPWPIKYERKFCLSRQVATSELQAGGCPCSLRPRRRRYGSRALSQCLSHLGLLSQEYHRLSDLNSIHLFVTVLEAGKSKISMPTWSGSGESPLSGFFTWQRERKREVSGLFIPL